jgi:2-polyprenyl-3-methyl-5-hydroxy-6-metoxy-1,4-benzoquinol methylase
MIKQGIKKTLRYFGYEIHRVESFSQENRARVPITQPPPINPVWPLPRRSGGPSEGEIREEFAKYDQWHYEYKFDGGLSFPVRHNLPNPVFDAPDRPLQRFKHFMPYLVETQNGSLRNKRILDIACNSGFWSIQCALLGAEVVGFDARADLIKQANLIKSIVSLNNVEFKVLDFWNMSPQSLDGTFDIVLNLGILYHLPKPLEALELTKSMTRRIILLDTQLIRSNDSIIKLLWEEPHDIRLANISGVVTRPSKRSIELMLRHIGAAEWFEIPIRTTDMPRDYLDHWRASWLVKV